MVACCGFAVEKAVVRAGNRFLWVVMVVRLRTIRSVNARNGIQVSRRERNVLVGGEIAWETLENVNIFVTLPSDPVFFWR